MSELKPCPHCGGVAEISEVGGTDIMFLVSCDDIQCNSAYDTQEEAIAA